MQIKILVVSNDTEPALEIVSIIGFPQAKIDAYQDAFKAATAAAKNKYDLILLGDGLKEGDCYDTALRLKVDTKSKGVPVLYIGRNKSMGARLVSLLRPFCYLADKDNLKDSATKVKSFFETTKQVV